MSNDAKATRSQQREIAREKARELREARAKSEKRNRLVKQFAIIALALGVVSGLIATFMVLANNAANQPSDKIITPANMNWDNGIKIGAGFKAITKPTTPSATPTPVASSTATNVPNVIVYLDYQCPICGAFEKAQGDNLTNWVKDGAITLELHPVAFLDGPPGFQTTDYSKLAANAAVCVADQAPDSFFAFNALLYKNQMSEGSQSFSDQQYSDFAKTAGVGDKLPAISKCIASHRFVPWMLYEATKFSQTNKKDYNSHWLDHIPGWATPPGNGTPLVLVNNKVPANGVIFDPTAFAQLVMRAATGK
jgi:protein-disulfide isomerase